MPSGEEHAEYGKKLALLMIGVVVAVGFQYGFSQAGLLIGIGSIGVVVYYGSLLPDTDSHSSIINRQVTDLMQIVILIVGIATTMLWGEQIMEIVSALAPGIPRWVGVIGVLALAIISANGVGTFIDESTTHRGTLHSASFWVAMSAIVYFAASEGLKMLLAFKEAQVIGALLAVGLFVGVYFGHLVPDGEA